MSDTAQMELVSTGELARRLGRSLSGIRKLEAQGRIPRSTTIMGSGRKVWKLQDLPAIEEALRENSRRQGAAAA
jgi:hypothetical protein